MPYSPTSRPSSTSRRLVLAATAAALTAGLSTGIASADTPEAPEATAATATSSILGSSGSSSWTDTKRAISDIFSCKYNPNLPWCRNR
ncbi:Putative secreted protein [Corynebacterium glyciniphilum AJ 3170]|uniref:Putative secreted protein n=1 Tax=Corynebacterium glyciniphilum AJ 3170 TaxID=1404245 RepID=X5DQ78_9CORY|nr:hypothetical protein [Corynebacterium glyciniphilum]AHW65373.1 Putative secreted protein [Corynebacterium glyciniphilum AJ 3170]